MDQFLVSLGYLPPTANGAAVPRRQEPGRSIIIETKKPADRIEVKLETDIATFMVSSPSGIGRATITTAKGEWPTTVVLRLHLAGLEHLAISNGKVRLSGSVQSQSGTAARRRLTDDGSNEERTVEPAIEVFDANGQPSSGLPGRGGYFQITLPKELLTGRPRRLEVEWIDFYRG